MLNIITALQAEAAPIIEGLALTPSPKPLVAGHAIFCADGVRLGISGMGCANAGILTDYFLADNKRPYEPVYWLNFGIAGSAVQEIGNLILVQTVTAQSSGKTWTLAEIKGINLNLPTAPLCTVTSPQTTYQGNNIYDMEAAGIVSLLSDRHALEQLFCVKIISDGPDSPLESLTKQDIRNMLNDRKKDILAVTEKIYSASLQRLPESIT